MSELHPTDDELARMQAAVADAYYDLADEFEEYDEGSPGPHSEMGSFSGLVNAPGELLDRYAADVKANLAMRDA